LAFALSHALENDPVAGMACCKVVDIEDLFVVVQGRTDYVAPVDIKVHYIVVHTAAVYISADDVGTGVCYTNTDVARIELVGDDTVFLARCTSSLVGYTTRQGCIHAYLVGNSCLLPVSVIGPVGPPYGSPGPDYVVAPVCA